MSGLFTSNLIKAAHKAALFCPFLFCSPFRKIFALEHLRSEALGSSDELELAHTQKTLKGANEVLSALLAGPCPW